MIRRRRVRQRSATRPVSVLSIDEGRTVETEADKARNDLLDLVESQKTGRILTGTLQGVERAVNSKTGSTAVIYHGAFKVIIPAEEAVTLPEDTRGRSPDELYHYMLTKRLGAEVDYIVKGIDQQSNLAVGSRLEAMAAKRKEYYFGTDWDGNHRIYSGVCAEARIVSVIRAGIFVDLFGLETYIPLRELSYQRWMDAGLYFQAGQRVLVKVLEVERSGKYQVRVMASVKQAGENPYEKALRMYSVDSCYVGTVSMVDVNGVFVALDGGIDCLCSYPKRGRPPRGARVTVRILGINHESNRIWGAITHIAAAHIGNISKKEQSRRAELAASTRAALREALPIEYEDSTSLSVNLSGWYLQISFSPLHPLMVICLARAIPIPVSVAQFLDTNDMNLHSKGVLENFDFANSVPGVTIRAAGNTLTLSTTEPILSPKTSNKVDSNGAKRGGKGAVAVWRTSDTSQQNFATYNASGGDPVSCYIKVKTDAVGSAGLKKTSEDGKVSGIQFQITGSDGSTTKTTDANGNIDIDGLPIYAADGSKITYTATEINIPNKYVKPQSQTFQLTEGQTASIHFENKLKRWRVTVTKADNKTGSTPQGNGSLKGATFGVYQGGTLVKEYTVGDDLSFTTDYFPYGEDWSLKEISAGEGYKVSTVVTDLCEIPAGSNEEYNDNTATVTNEVIRGGVSVEKRDSKTGKKPQGDADFSGIQFEIVNKSKNPVEVNGKRAAPDEVAMTITTNAQGVASTGPNDLPYGDYLICESKTNASMRKTFTEEIPVTVSEDGKVFTFTADNDVVRGGIAIQKRDSQTGETPQGNADFAGIVFEIVNSSANLVVVDDKTIAPNEDAATITTDENGYASTEDELLPYGHYTVREKSTNSSMLLTFREQTVDVTEDKKVYNVYADNDVVRGGLSVQKLDSKTGEKPQGDANFAGIVFEIINDSENPVVVGGTSYAPGKVVKEITTNATGFAATGPNDLPYGDYLVREKSTNSSMLLTFTEEIPVTVSENGKVYPFTAENDVVRGGIAIQKHDSQTGATPQGNADFAGIVFEIVNNSANPVVVDDKTIAPNEVAATITTDENGYASTADDALPFGRYIVREKATNKSMLLTWPEQEVTVNENKKVYPVTAVDDVVRGGLAVEKRDTITGNTPQGNADFEGIVFEVINNSKNPVIVNEKSIAPGEVALTLTTDSEGKCNTAEDALPYGEYVLHEASTNASMLNTAPDQTVTIGEHLKMYTHYMDNEVVRGGVLIEKRDLESLLLTPLGGASLDGTLFEITNKSKRAVYVNGALYEPDTVCLTIEVKDGVAQSDVRALPYGTYTLAESKPGKGYLWTDKKIRDFEVREDGFVKEYREGEAAYNQVIRGELKFVKVGEKNMHRFANVAFKLTSQTTGESHILLTDENGEVRTETTWNPHTQNTNGNDDKLEAEWDNLTGTWFGLTTEGWMVETQDGLCALPFDQYTLEELRCAGNEGYELVTVPNITISRNTAVIELGTIDDHEGNTPKIGTTATVDGEKIAEPLSEVTLVDTVRYSGLTAGKTYKLSGVLMDKATGEPLTVDGKQVTAEKEFTPKNESGTEELSYTFNASALAGKAVVVFEDLYEDDKKVASHAKIGDEGQTVTFTEPKIGTTATANGEHTAQPVGEITIIDTVKYSGLIPGKEYTVKGVLMDKATDEKLLVDSKEITAEATFRASKDEGSIDVPFTFDASALAGKTVVAFETLYKDKLEVAVHADIEDEDQTITFSEKPEIRTTATVNGEKKTEPKGEVTLTDTVSYSGLTPGKTYKLSGVLMDKSSNAPLLVDGQKVTAEKEFTPENANGTEEMTFTFDASALAGKSVVVFESLYQEDKEVAVHADITDEGQRVEFTTPDKPEIKTTATVDGNKLVPPLEEITLIDTVAYSNLIPGKTYILKGVLLDKSTGEKLLVDGKEITAEKEFTPDKPTGTIDIPFTFKGISLAGKSIVVFENLYHEGVEVAVHADINDSNQTVEIAKPDEPSIKTKAAVNGEQKAHAVGEIAIIDTVSYVNLTPGKTYKLSGILMDKETGKPLEINGKQITAEKEFTPDKAVGTIDISFTFDASALKGKTIVVFEELFHEGKNVASHADIDDTDQTITFDTPEIKTKATVDGEKEADPLEKITLTDTVTYSNLTPGKTYTVKGVLMDKSTGKKLLIDGKEITADTKFTPDKADGTVDLSFTFNASGLAGKSVVAFETLYHEDIEVAVHADIDDDDQTVVIRQPKLKTTATIGGKKEATVAKELVLEDKAAYTGLTPGKEYTVKGVLMDKSTGKKFLVDGKEITAEATFTPEKSEGEVTVTFKFDGSKITAKTNLVVFETLYRDGKEIAAHADIKDEGQTVTLTPEKPKTPDVPKTGDDRNITLPVILLGASLAGLATLFLFWFRRKKASPQTGSENEGRK
ncbi:VaFE repeat-containing surface-anchored protein [Acutalibacter muris]|uniref:VaFE repeat-containing surface-anchored protein n=1 Tax=Acutalibacter muris TaxID=1796620 RepID=UPI001F40F024|nr:VaFE repeat-containing surface-anchored protein [Acutalibacter muris]